MTRAAAERLRAAKAAETARAAEPAKAVKAAEPAPTKHVQESAAAQPKTGPEVARSASVLRRAVVLDTETTGLDATVHRVLEIAFKLVDMESGAVHAAYRSVVLLDDAEWAAASPQALAVNGFTRAQMLAEGVPRASVRADICAFFAAHNLSPRTAFFLCQNPSFDRRFFDQLVPPAEQRSRGFPYHWYDLASMNWAVEAREIACGRKEPYRIASSKDGIAYWLGLPPEAAPHRAMNGVDHLLEIYAKLVGFATPS